MIVGTAGHIDHGKTTLVKALTGVDTDRLKEEKARGITIDLGFAYARFAKDAVTGFVDVPGHERFIHTMLAGAGGIDYAMLVVAADDGIKPQTLEHLAILDLLGVSRGLVAITKADLADPARLENLTDEIGAVLSSTSLRDAEILPVSVAAGQGIELLKERLAAAECATAASAVGGRFRLAVDRSFTLSGAGTVVTGTVLSGSVGVGDQVTVSPAGRSARVRSIHAQNQRAERGFAGQRCALTLRARGSRRTQSPEATWWSIPICTRRATGSTRISLCLKVRRSRSGNGFRPASTTRALRPAFASCRSRDHCCRASVGGFNSCSTVRSRLLSATGLFCATFQPGARSVEDGSWTCGRPRASGALPSG